MNLQNRHGLSKMSEIAQTFNNVQVPFVNKTNYSSKLLIDKVEYFLLIVSKNLENAALTILLKTSNFGSFTNQLVSNGYFV